MCIHECVLLLSSVLGTKYYMVCISPGHLISPDRDSVTLEGHRPNVSLTTFAQSAHYPCSEIGSLCVFNITFNGPLADVFI